MLVVNFGTIFFWFLLISFFDSSKSTNVECSFQVQPWIGLGSAYYCEVKTIDAINTKQLAKISSVTGVHQSGKNDNDSLGFQITRKNVQFFPQALEKFFLNLRAISIYICPLKEIRQSDLKPFPKLSYLFLRHTDIEVLEKGLFDFNTELEIIYVHNNKIVQIEHNVFDNLAKLSTLLLNSNICIDKEANNKQEVKDVAKHSYTACQDVKFLEIDQKLKELEENPLFSSSGSFLVISHKLNALQDLIKNSNFMSFFKNRMELLSEWKDQKFWILKDKMDTIESSLLNLSVNVKQNQNELCTDIKNVIIESNESNSAAIATLNDKIFKLETSITTSILELQTSISAIGAIVKESIDSSMQIMKNFQNDIDEKLSVQSNKIKQLIDFSCFQKDLMANFASSIMKNEHKCQRKDDYLN